MTARKPPERTFEISEGVRQSVPLFFGLFGPSGGGKTWTGLELATGIQEHVGGDIVGIDTEGRRMLAYADRFKFKHLPLVAPFGSLDYLAAMRAAAKSGAKVILVDSMSHEHEGPGGMIEFHEAELDRMAGDSYDKRERMKMLAWAKPKAARRALLNGMLQIEGVHFILCFRAKQTAKPVKVQQENGSTKTEVVQQGFMPIAGDEFVFEMTVSALLLPGAAGVPTWRSESPGERMMIKLPEQFRRGLLERGDKPLDRTVGKSLAKWATGGAAAPAPSTVKEPLESAQDGQDAAPSQDSGQAADPASGAATREGEGVSPETSAKPDAGAQAGDMFPGDKPASDAGAPPAETKPEPPKAETRPADDRPPPIGFAEFADLLAAARSKLGIDDAVSRLIRSDEFKGAEPTMRSRARALAHKRFVEGVNAGDIKGDFVADAHAFRNYIEAEEDPEVLEVNWRAFQQSASFKSLPEQARAKIAEAVRDRKALLATAKPAAPQAGAEDFE